MLWKHNYLLCIMEFYFISSRRNCQFKTLGVLLKISLVKGMKTLLWFSVYWSFQLRSASRIFKKIWKSFEMVYIFIASVNHGWPQCQQLLWGKVIGLYMVVFALHHVRNSFRKYANELNFDVDQFAVDVIHF